MIPIYSSPRTLQLFSLGYGAPVKVILGGARHSLLHRRGECRVGRERCPPRCSRAGYRSPDRRPWAFAGNGTEQQPLDVVGIRGAALLDHPDDFASAHAFPRWAGVLNADETSTAGVGKQVRLGRHEDPTCAVPAINLHALGIHAEKSFIPRLHGQVVATVQVPRRPTLTLAPHCRNRECDGE